MIKTSKYYEFRSHKLHKSWRKGQSPPSLKIYVFLSDKALCAVAALDCYIERSSIWWEENQTSQLLVSFIKPHNAVAKSTVAGWVKQILIMSGINTDIFKPHSTRSASSSHARLSGLSLSDILKRGSWSNKRFKTNLSWNLKKNFRKLLWIRKALKRGGWGSGLCFYIAMTLGEYNIRSKQRFYEIKFRNYIKPWSGCNVIGILWIKSK